MSGYTLHLIRVVTKRCILPVNCRLLLHRCYSCHCAWKFHFSPLKRQSIKLFWNFDASGTVYSVAQHNIPRTFSSTGLRNSNLTSSFHMLITSLSVMFPFRWTLVIVCAEDTASFRPITSKPSLTYSIEQSPSWEGNGFSASQRIPHILWNP